MAIYKIAAPDFKALLGTYRNNILGGLAGAAVGGGLGAMNTNTDDDEPGEGTGHRICNAFAGMLAGGTLGATAPVIAKDLGYGVPPTPPPAKNILSQTVDRIPHEITSVIKPYGVRPDTAENRNLVLEQSGIGAGSGLLIGKTVGRSLDRKAIDEAAANTVKTRTDRYNTAVTEHDQLHARDALKTEIPLKEQARDSALQSYLSIKSNRNTPPKVLEKAEARAKATQADLDAANNLFKEKFDFSADRLSPARRSIIQRGVTEGEQFLHGGEAAALARAAKGTHSRIGLLGGLIGSLAGGISPSFFTTFEKPQPGSAPQQ